MDVAAGGDGRTGTISSPIYDPPPGLSPRRVSAGPDGTSRVLLTDAGSAGVVWVLSPEGVFQASFGLD